MNKHKIILIITGLLYLVLVVLTLVSGVTFFKDRDATLGINLGMFLIIIGAAAILLFSIYQLIDNPRKSLPSLLGLAGIIVIFFIVYAGSSSADTFGKVTEGTAKLIGGSMGLLYILGLISVISIIASEIWGLFK